MRKIRILASQDSGDAVFERLRDLELMQVKVGTGERLAAAGSPDVPELEARGPAVESPACQDKLAKLSAVKACLERYNPMQKGFIDMFIGTKPELTWDEFRDAVRREDVDSAHAKVTAHDARLRDIAKELGEIAARQAALEDWRDLDLPIASIGPTASCETVLAVVPASGWAVYEQSLAGKPVCSETVWQKRDRLGIWLVSLVEQSGPASSLAQAAGGSVVELSRGEGSGEESSRGTGSVVEELAALEEKRGTLLEEQEKIVQEDTEMSSGLLRVLALTDYYLDRKNLGETLEKTSRTAYTLVIDGFVKEKDVPRLRAALSDLAEVEVVDEEPGGDEEVPIYLENPPLIRPFETVTNIFGFPRYKEIDPTPWLAPFFWIYFGITLGDVFYGLILAAGCCWLLKTKRQLSDGGRKLVTLLLYSSFSMMIVGVITGSWFGDLASAFMPATVVERFVNRLTLLHPVSDPLTLMVISLALGIFQIWVGIGIKGLALVRSGQVGEAIIAQGSWMVFIPGLVAWGLSKTGLIRSAIPFYVMIAGALMVMYSSSRGTKSIFLKPFSGAYGLYATISYLADTLSYSRLLALGLASAIIAVVINKIAQLVVVMVPVVGWVFVPVVLLVGHAFNLVVNLLGSFIHSGRLQFVEFFTKFFEGGGRPFKPLRRVNENVSLR